MIRQSTISTLVPYPILFFFNDTATTEIYTLSLHDALPISSRRRVLRAGGLLGAFGAAGRPVRALADAGDRGRPGAGIEFLQSPGAGPPAGAVRVLQDRGSAARGGAPPGAPQAPGPGPAGLSRASQNNQRPGSPLQNRHRRSARRSVRCSVRQRAPTAARSAVPSAAKNAAGTSGEPPSTAHRSAAPTRPAAPASAAA